MKPLIAVGLAVFGAGLVAGCGDDLECGPGTADVDGQCIAGGDDTTAPTTSISPDPGTYRTVGGVTLTADEPAIIFFTIDGSEPNAATSFGGFSPLTLPALEAGADVKFFAVDEAGNVEATQTATFAIDQRPPAPACGFNTSVDGLDASISWTNPADDDFGGIIVVRYDAVAAVGRPVDGDFYSAGDNLPGGGEVILAGSDTSLTDTLPAATGAYVYAVWAHDTLGNYSIASSNLPIATEFPTQSATLTIDLATNAVTIDQQPADLALMVTATYDPGVQVLSLDVSARNNTMRQLFNLRLESTEIATNPGGLQGGIPPSAGSFGTPLAADGSGSASLAIGSVPNTAATATVELEFETAPYVLGRRNAVSASGLDPSFRLDIEFAENSRGVVVNPIATQAFFDQKQGATLVFDMVTFTEIGPLVIDEGAVHASAFTNAGVPFVVSQGFSHWYGTRGGERARLFDNPVRLHQLDPLTLEPVRSLDVLRASGLTARSLLLFPDCRTAALLLGSGDPTVGNKLAIVDINQMEVDRIIDLPQPAAGPALAARAALSPDAGTIYVGLNSRARVLINSIEDEGGGDRLGGGGSGSNVVVPLLSVDLSTDQVTQIEIAGGGQIAAGILAVGDIVYYSSRARSFGATPVVAIDTANGNAVSTVVAPDVFSGTNGGGNIVMAPTGDAFAVWSGTRDSSEGVVVSLETGAIIDGASLPTIQVDPHGVAVTPF